MRKLLILSQFVFFATGAQAQNILPRTTYFYDSYGNISGSATSNPVTGQTVINNQYGGYEGSINPAGPGKAVINDDQGNFMGTMSSPVPFE